MYCQCCETIGVTINAEGYCGKCVMRLGLCRIGDHPPASVCQTCSHRKKCPAEIEARILVMHPEMRV